MKLVSKILIISLLFGSLPLLQGCFSGSNVEQSYPKDLEDTRREKRGKLTGEGGVKIFGGDDKKSGGSGIGVNSFLWRATLDTLSFMPLAQVDPHGGVIITDWYEDPGTRGERFKVNVLILGTDLRADGIRVSVFRKTKESNGEWRDDKVGSDTPTQLEDKILTRARELRIGSAK